MITAEVSGDRDIALRLDRFPSRLNEALAVRFGRLAEQMAADERARAPNRTGKLRSEIQSRLTQTPELVRAQVRVAADTANEFAKAGALEYGAHGTAAVRAFQRLGHTPEGSPAEQMVAAYNRRLSISAFRFARGALDDFRGAAKEAVAEALGQS